MLRNFIITNGQRSIHPSDILFSGRKCLAINDKVFKYLESNKIERNLATLNNIKRIKRILVNTKVDDLIITKFVDHIWSKHSYFSDAGDLYLDMNKMFDIFPYLDVTDKDIVYSNITASRKLQKM